VERFLQESGVERLTVGMGLQCADEDYAANVLRRPDRNAAFVDAIAALRRLNVGANVYVLWGFGADDATWFRLLMESLDWARRVGVEGVTVCPYVLPVGSADARAPFANGGSLCALRRQLAALRGHGGACVIRVAAREEPWCGVEYAGGGCETCRLSLVSGTWDNFYLYPCESVKEEVSQRRAKFRFLKHYATFRARALQSVPVVPQGGNAWCCRIDIFS